MGDESLESIIARAIASVPAARAPEAVLQAIRDGHVIVPKADRRYNGPLWCTSCQQAYWGYEGNCGVCGTELEKGVRMSAPPAKLKHDHSAHNATSLCCRRW